MDFITQIHTEEYQGFTVTTNACIEHDPPDWDMSKAELRKFWQDLDRGNLAWFCAQVMASKDGVVLAIEYLGGCCYSRYDDFIEESGHYSDMRDGVIRQAREKIRGLCQFIRHNPSSCRIGM